MVRDSRPWSTVHGLDEGWVKVFGSNEMNRRRISKPWGKKVFTRMGAITVVVLLVIAARYHVDWSKVMGTVEQLEMLLYIHPYFSVKEITVTGYKKVGGSEIVALAGLKPGVNIWKVNPTRIEAKLSRHPWVRRGVVRREFPRRVIIQIEEWKAKGIVVLEKLYYANADGIVFKTVEPGEKTNLPFITGLEKEGSGLNNRQTQKRISEALTLSDLFAKSSMAVSEIRFRPQGEVIAYPISHSVPLHMGWGNWSGKVQRLKRVWMEWKGREQYLASLDLSFRGQVVVKWRERT